MAFNKRSFSDTQKAVLTTILYSDIFHFPLTHTELWKYLISEKRITRKAFTEALANLSDVVATRDGYYFLTGKESLVTERKRLQAEVKKKLHIAKRAAFFLSHIPTIRFIGISGGLAVSNVKKEDDIDLFIIVKKGTLFMTRFWVVCMLEWLGMRRRRNEQFPADKICVNLLLDETKLLWPKKSRDLYSAHEIAQIQPLFERDNMFQRFMDSNQWIRTFLPNSQDEKEVFLGNTKSTNYLILQFFSYFIFIQPFETWLRKLQEHYMKKHQTTEVVSKNVLAFHPNDYRIEIMSKLRLKCENLGLLTKP